MRRLTYTLLLFVMFSGSLKGQILPAEDSKLNYRLIGFSFPLTGKQVAKYTLEIASGSYNSEDSFKNNIIMSLPGKQNKTIAEAPSFGSAYTWRVVYTVSGSKNISSELHHFTTMTAPEVDTNITRLRIINPAETYKDAYVFVDDNKAIYDMKGRPVWYLPDIEGSLAGLSIRDMKLSPFGTITLLIEKKQAYEISYDGVVLWKSPNTGKVGGGGSEQYHHEFTRQKNGNYMVLGITDTSLRVKNDDADSIGHDQKTPFGTLIEYDRKGNVVWQWKSTAYFLKNDLPYRKAFGVRNTFDTHPNAFYFNEKDKTIYLSFREISRVIKIKYPAGNILNAYGEIYTPGKWEAGNPFFCHQHSPRKSQNGYLYLYNNGCDGGSAPRVEILEEAPGEKWGLRKIWEYVCTADGVIDPGKKVFWLVRSGNVMELPDSSLFVCMGSQLGKLFIVNLDKKIVWSAVPERWNSTTGRWDFIPQYRASIITSRKELEQLIWSNEKKK